MTSKMLPPGQTDLVAHTGLHEEGGGAAVLDQEAFQQIILMKLAANGHSLPDDLDDPPPKVLHITKDLFRVYHEQSRLLESHLPPIDRRIQTFLDSILPENERVQVPTHSFCVDRYGMSRLMSFPRGENEYHSSEIDSYYLSNGGVLHNPINDKRTTKGVFHVADYGLPVPADKIPVPLVTFARLLKEAFNPPSDMNTVPYTSNWKAPAETMVSLLLRPLVVPEVPGISAEKRHEVHFFAPGSCCSNVDFLESIFGNAGDPNLPENDSALDPMHFTGTTGCVVLAPHLRKMKKKDMGLPHISEATDKQKATGMCWESPDELYNKGSPFKITLRDERGMVTILADNYFGYCKKEVKTQIGLTANIFGLAEEEHAGGALAFKTSNIGSRFTANPRYMQTLVPSHKVENTYKFQDAIELLGDSMTIDKVAGYATDKRFEDLHLLPEDMDLNVQTQTATFTNPYTGKISEIRILPNHTYLHPSGYKVKVSKHPKSPNWRLIGTLPEPTFCHKPSTVSGGGKSEISKPLEDAVEYGPIFIGEYEQDMEMVRDIINRSYSDAIKPEYAKGRSSASRPILSPERTLGSVIKLLTPDLIYTESHNAFVEKIPNHIRAIVFAIKSNYNVEMGDDWMKHFTVDITNGVPGHELKFGDRQLVGSYLRVGSWKNGSRRNFKMRQDFCAAAKVQMEDDITASVVVSRDKLSGLPKEYDLFPSVKLSQNCEWRLFQRPDDAIIPGYDKQTEEDMAGQMLLCANFEPIQPKEMKNLTEELYFFDRFTKPMAEHMDNFAKEDENNFAICSAKPRLVQGKPTKNPRYLQVRPDVFFPKDRYLAELGARLYRRISNDNACIFPVAGVISGRRNNPPDVLNGKPIRPLCVYNPLHYQELPELLMDYICCVTGKSPSTTGAGSEGALSKGPFNAIGATADLNNMLVSMLLTGYGGFSSAAGYVGPDYKVDHDISLIIPELWCRMTPEERDPKFLIDNGYLEPISDFEYQGRTILASRLGYRITQRFVHQFFCRIFDNPAGVFSQDMLKPETQNMEVYVDGIENICQAMEGSALKYFEDGIINDACPPLRAVLHCMAYGNYNGKTIHDPEIRSMFTREYLLESNWYKARLAKKQNRDIALWQRNVDNLQSFLDRPGYSLEAERLKIVEKLSDAKAMLARVQNPSYLVELEGTLGADPIHDGYSMVESVVPTDVVSASKHVDNKDSGWAEKLRLKQKIEA